MTSYLTRRFGYMLIILVLSTVGIFYALRFSGDPARSNLNPLSTEEQRQEFRERHGLDDPNWQQYFRYVGDLFQGDLGRSLANGRPVSDMLKENGKNSLILVAAATGLTYLIAIPLGVLAAVRRNTWVDQTALGGAAVGMGVPNFWLALLLVWLFAVTLGWLPSAGCCGWKELIMPMIVLAAEGTAVVMRMMRSSMLEQLNQDFVRVLRAKGTPERTILSRHVLRNALIPVISLSGLRLGQIIGYTFIVEVIFRWPGVGFVLVNGTLTNDFPVVQFFSILLIFVVVLANWMAELAYGATDPRIRRA